MNDKLQIALEEGNAYLRKLGLTPIVCSSCLLGMMAYNELFEKDKEADLIFNGDLITPEIQEHFKKETRGYVHGSGIIYYDTSGSLASFDPFYIRGNKAYIHLKEDIYFVCDKIHLEKTQTKLFKGTRYDIPYDFIGFLETYYGDYWDDIDKRVDWHWKQAKNLVHLPKLP